jgi:hypothetical protein
LKLCNCGYRCHGHLLAYRPNVWFAAQSPNILQTVRVPLGSKINTTVRM